MENDLKIIVAICPDCRGYKSATPKKEYSLNPALVIKVNKLKQFVGDSLTLDFEEYESVQKSGNLSEYEVSADDFKDKFMFSDCGCTPICEQIKTFEDACTKLNIPHKVPNFVLPFPLDIQMQSFFMLTIITKALNEGWNPIKHKPVDNLNQVYYPDCFFNSSDYFPFKHLSHWIETERGENEYNEREPGFLLVFKNDGLAKYAGTQFRDLYLDYYQYPESYLNRFINQ